MPQVTLNPTINAFIDENVPTTNFGNIQIDVGESSPGVDKRRSLVKFDLSSITPGSTITGVTFRIYNSGGDLTGNNRTMRAYRVLRAWAEAQATWNVYTTGNSWGTAGCSNTTTDRENTELGTIDCVDPPSAGFQTCSFDTTKVQEWLDGGLANNGLIWVMDTESNDMQRFNGRSDANPPELVVDYTLPVTTSTSSSTTTTSTSTSTTTTSTSTSTTTSTSTSSSTTTTSTSTTTTSTSTTTTSTSTTTTTSTSTSTTTTQGLVFFVENPGD